MEKIEIDLCPFCKTELAAGATVCAECGARRGRRGDQYTGGQHLFRLGLWLCGPGGVLIVWLGIIPTVLWQIWVHDTAPSEFRHISQLWLWIGLMLGYPIFKVVNQIWSWIFGRLMDEVWLR
ncbi:MAG: hypothetical protein CK604_07130 [Curvibacter sp. PD_MW3]|nr:MAG: hypothetical protein CK604_07130 [Curvibacter sp. PD_MW3]